MYMLNLNNFMALDLLSLRFNTIFSFWAPSAKYKEDLKIALVNQYLKWVNYEEFYLESLFISEENFPDS